MAATSWVVLVEPSPTDAFMLLFILMTMLFFGIQIFKQLFSLLILISFYILFEMVALTNASNEFYVSVKFSLITIYLMFFMYFLAGMLNLYGQRIFVSLMDGWLIAALLSSLTVILGFFDIIPRDLVMDNTDGFRMRGLFKDPNVSGPFIIPPLLYLLSFRNNFISRNFGITLRYFSILFMLVGLLLSFSRAAYINFFVTLFVFYTLLDFTKYGFRTGFFFVFKVFIIIIIFIFLAYQLSIIFGIEEFLTSRLQLQEYDSSRFGNWKTSFELILKNPEGIGPGQFKLSSYAGIHSLYLAVATESGLISFILFTVIIFISLLRALFMSFKSAEFSIFYVFAFSVLIGVLVNSLVLNTIHWRHLFIIIALGFGCYTSSDRQHFKKVNKLV